MKKVMFIVGILALIALVSCEQECPGCFECELEHLGENSEWGEMIKSDLQNTFLGIEELFRVAVFNTVGDTTYWSGLDFGGIDDDPRQIQVDFLEIELVLIFKNFQNGRWTHCLTQIPYNDIVTYVLQYVTIIRNGQVVRIANSVLIFLADGANPPVIIGHSAEIADPVGYSVNITKKIALP